MLGRGSVGAGVVSGEGRGGGRGGFGRGDGGLRGRGGKRTLEFFGEGLL